MFALGELDIWSPCDHSIYFSLCSKFDMLPSATRVDSAFFLLAPQGIYRAAAGGISSGASAAHIDVESSCQKHHGFNVGGEDKRYIL